MSSARPPDQQHRGSHARHRGPGGQAGGGDRPGAGGSGPGAGGSGAGAGGPAGRARRSPRHAAPGREDSGYRTLGGRPAGPGTSGYRPAAAGGPSAGPRHPGPQYAQDAHPPPADNGAAVPRAPEGAGLVPGAAARAPVLPRGHPAPGRDGQRGYGPPRGGRRDEAEAPAAPGAGTRSHRRQPPGPVGQRGRPGRRRGRRRVLIWAGAGLLAAAAAAAAVLLLSPGPGGPAHTLTTPARLGAYLRRPRLAQQMDVAELEKDIIAQSSGQASHLVSAVYQDGSAVPGAPAPRVLLFIGGKLAGASADASVRSFAQDFRHAGQAAPGRLGGAAACVPPQPGTHGAAVCAWFDNDTFGELVSPNMTAAALAGELRAIRPSIEKVSG